MIHLFVSLACVLATGSQAATFKGVEMQDKIQVQSKTLLLNGQALRTKFGFKVYVAGLYLETPSKDAEGIIASSQFKRVDLHFLRDVGSEKLQNGWRETFQKYCKEGPCADAQKSRFEQFLTAHTDIKEDQTISYTFVQKKLEISTQGKILTTLEDSEFSRLILSAWLGSQVSDVSIRSGLLGIKEGE